MCRLKKGFTQICYENRLFARNFDSVFTDLKPCFFFLRIHKEFTFPTHDPHRTRTTTKELCGGTISCEMYPICSSGRPADHLATGGLLVPSSLSKSHCCHTRTTPPPVNVCVEREVRPVAVVARKSLSQYIGINKE